VIAKCLAVRGGEDVLVVVDPATSSIGEALGHAPTTPSIRYTRACKRAPEAGALGATLPGVAEDMLARAMAVDFEAMVARPPPVLDAGRCVQSG
jgi:hypothetical protein